MTPLPRDRFPITQSARRWFDHAGVSPVSLDAAEVLRRWADLAANEGGGTIEPMPTRVRALAGELLGVRAADVLFTTSTTDGIGLVTAGMAWAPRDRVVVADCEFVSNLYPWLALRDRGVRVDVVRLDEMNDALRTGPAPTVAAVSWVQYARGERTDLASLAEAVHWRGGLLVADVVQGAGVLPCTLADWGVDVAVAGAHKWLLGPIGVALAVVSEDARNRIRPVAPGWASVTPHDDYEDYTFDLLPDARRYEGGTLADGLIAAMGASIQLLLDAGIDAVWRHVDELCEHLIAGLPSRARVLSDRTQEGRSGIVTVALDGAERTAVVRHLRNQGIEVRNRGGGVRFAPHGYTSTGDVDAALAGLHSVV